MNRFSMRFVAEFAELLTTALMHFVWQGAVLTLMLLVLVKVLDVRTARLRYLLSVGTLLMMGIAPFLTILLCHNGNSSQKQSPVDVSAKSNAIIEIPSDAAVEAKSATITTEVINMDRPVISAMPPSANIQIFVLIAWLAGVLILSTRLAIGFGVTLWIRANVKPLSEQFEQRVRILGDRLRVVARNRVFTCAKVGQAVAVGFVRPVVLIPVAWLTQLPPEMLEAIIAHELAHIRRWDLWVNLVQRIIETLLFYHPAVWWLSRRIRLEREMCCDEIAAGCFDRAMYARSLESVARIAHGNLLMAASINGGKNMNLLHRVRYLLGVVPAEATGNWWAVGFVALIIPFVAGVVVSVATETTPTVATADERTKAAKSGSPSDSRSELEGKKAGDQKELAGIAFRWCPAGTFTMGSPKSESGRRDFEDQVSVELTKGFWLGETEITQGQWRKLMGSKPWSGSRDVGEGENYPAIDISYDDVLSFCEKLTKQERNAGRLPQGWKYSLPTEAQWEYACRAGTTTKFYFGEDESKLNEYGWFKFSGPGTHLEPVGQKKPNNWGLKDMHGNVGEWCIDWLGGELEGGRDPQEDWGVARVIRGGGWNLDADKCRSAARNGGRPNHTMFNWGFRLAAVPE